MVDADPGPIQEPEGCESEGEAREALRREQGREPERNSGIVRKPLGRQSLHGA